MTDRVFGYGSLVNRATHGFAAAAHARLAGWRRVWVQTGARPVAYLSARPGEGELLGLVLDVAAADWPALDRREAGYARHPVTPEARGGSLAAQIYAVPEGQAAPPSARHPILLSYLDAVVQGFLREFGPEGVAGFFATTDGWDAPVLDDRAAPRYPRAQHLAPTERAAVDAGLHAAGARILRAGADRGSVPPA